MKRHLLFVGLFMLVFSFVQAQSKPYNVVFDLTSSDTTDQKTVIRWINTILSDHPTANLEVVLYGQSLGMVTQNSVVQKDIKKLEANKNVAFVVCAASMKRHNIEQSQLLPSIQIVPDGIYEIVQKQNAGWGYIKAAH
jgi:uncharacterized protein